MSHLLKKVGGHVPQSSHGLTPMTVTVAILEVYMYCVLRQCNVVNSRMLANCSVWNCPPVEIHGLRITLASKLSDFRSFDSLFVHIKYTSNMATCFYAQCTAPRVLTGWQRRWTEMPPITCKPKHFIFSTADWLTTGSVARCFRRKAANNVWKNSPNSCRPVGYYKCFRNAAQ